VELVYEMQGSGIGSESFAQPTCGFQFNIECTE
jgi:hypothetical protein